jgi:mannitol operon transcriptional antiterminator
MISLTNQQRNLLCLLLETEGPIAVASLAQKVDLTPRQVNYRLKSVRVWLAQHEVLLQSKPGVGVTVLCSLKQRQYLLRELNSQTNFPFVLTAHQRQQLFALRLLISCAPLNVSELQRGADVSRTTVVKDLQLIEQWSHSFGIILNRRPNYGIEFTGTELARRQALGALLWGDSFFGKPVTVMSHGTGLSFALPGNASVPIVQETVQQIKTWNTWPSFEWVAFAEAQLGMRFTDDAVRFLALNFAIQAQRVTDVDCRTNINFETTDWLKTQKVWTVATDLANIMWPSLSHITLESEKATLAMYLLSGVRENMWPGDLEIDPSLTDLVDLLMAEIALAFATPALRHDTPLRDGLVAHIIPAYMRERFGLWAPPLWSDNTVDRRYEQEYRIAQELARIVTERTGVVLPDGELDTITLLLRAAFIRESANRPKRVFIICPSGMATAQILAARLKTRFPSLDIAGVVSLRKLTESQVSDAHLLISTVPAKSPVRGLNVIQVHPLLLPEDIEKITQWLA